MQTNTNRYDRNPVYVFFILGSIPLFWILSLMARRPNVSPTESSLFHLFYNLPSFVSNFLAPAALAISILAIVSALFLPLLYRRGDISARIALASTLAYVVSSSLQEIVSRARPDQLLSGVSPSIDVSGFGFPSGQAAVLLVAALVMAVYAARRYRKWLIYSALVVSCGGIVLGISMPLDVIAGWVVSFFCYAVTLLAIGSPSRKIGAEELSEKLLEGGMEDVVLKPASVDARGSVPFFGTSRGKDIFVKVFNQDNNAADWLFKMVRRIQYRRLEDEVPSLSPKRAIEHEAYLTMLAKYKAEARVPEVIGIYRVAANSYAMATERIDSTGLDKIDKKGISDKTLDLVWEQILKLHDYNIIHKDLRAANVMIENKTGLPWLIDFGFSECAVERSAHYKDNVEFIASSATKVGAQRAVAAAKRSIGHEVLSKALPYMQYAALSGATTTDLKKSKGLLDELRKEMMRAIEAGPNKVTKAKITRVSYPKKFKE